jgi:ADP-heptose:LPS heptosyltransferase
LRSMDEEQVLSTDELAKHVAGMVTGEADEADKVGKGDEVDMSRYLVTMYVGIGDAVTVGLSAIEQIIKNDPAAYGAIDVLCNDIQAELFQYDPRVNRVIQAQRVLFPPPEIATWLKGVVMDAQATQLVRFLRGRRYQAIFPGMFAPVFFYRLGAPVMYPYLLKLGKEMFSLRSFTDMPIGTLARQIVNRYFDDLLPTPSPGEIPSLYIGSVHVRRAIAALETIKALAKVPSEESKLLIVAPDTASNVTRPPTNLLAEGIADALRALPNLIAYILPGYTDKKAAQNLMERLHSSFPGRVFLRPHAPRAGLLELTAFLDQADIFVTGDTGLMHLAVACKCLTPDDDPYYMPRNRLKTIVLFGGTNPAFYGYSRHTTILGKGRKEQAAYRPGIVKESYNARGKNFFDHILPSQLTEAIICGATEKSIDFSGLSST